MNHVLHDSATLAKASVFLVILYVRWIICAKVAAVFWTFHDTAVFFMNFSVVAIFNVDPTARLIAEFSMFYDFTFVMPKFDIIVPRVRGEDSIPARCRDTGDIVTFAWLVDR